MMMEDTTVQRLLVFNHVTLDGYFTSPEGDMSWAHQGSDDPEFAAWVGGNAKSGGSLLFGRVTYEMMVSYWPTPQAKRDNPVVAEGMNNMPKVVFSRTLDRVSWSNTTLLKGDLVAEIRKLKQEPGEGMVIMGSGSIVAQLAPEGLIDEYQVVVNPIVLGKGRTMFDGVRKPLNLTLTRSRTFGNGKAVLSYQPKG
jgi:dihydrofolate reductase